MEKKNLLVRIFVPVVVAGMVFVGLPACFQDDGYPEGFVLNDEAGVATMAKRSMPQGGESIKPIEPEKPSYKCFAFRIYRWLYRLDDDGSLFL